MILEAMNNNLFDVYWNYQKTQISLPERHIVKDAGKISYLINNFINSRWLINQSWNKGKNAKVDRAQDIARIGEPIIKSCQLSTIIGT